jgi:hypothetical protein
MSFDGPPVGRSRWDSYADECADKVRCNSDLPRSKVAALSGSPPGTRSQGHRSHIDGGEATKSSVRLGSNWKVSTFHVIPRQYRHKFASGVPQSGEKLAWLGVTDRVFKVDDDPLMSRILPTTRLGS